MIINNLDRLPESLLPIKSRLSALLKDLKEINRHTKRMIFIEYQDWHDEYSVERVEPCPDYYGYYRLKAENEIIGEEMTLDELDSALMLISNYQEYASKC